MVIYDGNAVHIGVKVLVDYGNGEFLKKGVLKNSRLELEEPQNRAEYFFGGWFVSGNGYDFKTPVTKSFTITAKWLKDGENAVSITPNKVYVMSNAESKLFVSSYKNGKLMNLASVSAKPGFSWELSTIGLDTSGADKLSAFLWGENMQPLCGSDSVILP